MYNDQLESTIAKYNDKRDEIIAVLNEVEVAKSSSNKAMVHFVNKFYKTVNSAKRVKSDLIKKCI